MRLLDLLAPLAPPLCFACGGPARAGSPLCEACRARLSWLGPDPVAVGAGAPGPAAAGEAPAEADLPVWAPVAYRDGATALVRALKFRGAVDVAATMAAQIAANAPAGALLEGALVPVPLHPARRRRRGFNQAERLAAALAERTGLRVADCLRRSGGRGTQVGRGRGDRLAAIAGAVALRRGAAAPPAAILVDDVLTTRATLRACEAALRTAGAARVSAVAYARTPGR